MRKDYLILSVFLFALVVLLVNPHFKDSDSTPLVASKKVNLAIKEIIERDEKINERAAKVLSDSQWKVRKIGNITYFYTYSDDRLKRFSINAEAELNQISEFLGISKNAQKLVDIACFIFPENLWTKVSFMGDAFHDVGTSQIYLRASENKYAVSVFSHELSHFLLRKAYPGKTIPLWINEGVAQTMERPYYFWEANKDFKNKASNRVKVEQFHTLDEIITATHFPVNRDLFYFESFYLVKFLEHRFGQEQLKKIIKNYLRTGEPTVNNFLKSLEKLSSKEVILKEFEKEFLNFQLFDQKKDKRVVPNLNFETLSVNMGEYKVGEVLEHTFIGVNNTDYVIDIEDIKPKFGSNASVEVSTWSVAPKEKVQISVTINTAYPYPAGKITIFIPIILYAHETVATQLLELKAILY